MPDGANTSRDDFETGLTQDDRLDLRSWLRLLTCANMIEAEVRKRLREEFDITLARFDLLAQLDRAGNGLTMGELSRRMMVTNGNVTGLIDRLVDEALVTRAPDPDDRRVQIIELTRAGRRSFERMSKAHASWITELFSGLDRDHLTALYDELAHLKSSIAANAGPGDDT